LSEIESVNEVSDWTNSVGVRFKQNSADASHFSQSLMFQFGDRETAQTFMTVIQDSLKLSSQF